MLLDFVYGHSTWFIGLVMALGAAGYGCIGVLIVERLVPSELRRRHNEMIGYILAVAGVNYAVLLGFVAVSVWQSFDNAQDVVAREANLVGDLYRDAAGLAEPQATEIHHALHHYIQKVVNEEWPVMATGTSSRAGWGTLVHVSTLLKDYQPKGEMDKIFAAELLHQLNALYDARRSRAMAAESGVQPIVWFILLLCAAMIVGFTCLFAMDSRGIHMLLTATFAVGTALVLLLVVATDWPFRGEVRISADSFRDMATNMGAIDAPAPAPIPAPTPP